MRSLNKNAVQLIRWFKSNPSIAYPIIIFFVFRIITLLWMWQIRQIINQPVIPDPILRPYLGVTLENNPWLEPWQRWDTLHYQAIAERGYTAYDTALFVPPLFPLLMKLGGYLLGGNTLLAGIVISNIAFLFSLIVFFRLVEEEIKEKGAAARATLYLAVFPSAFFYFAAYTESVFLLAALLCFQSIRKEQWWQAGVWGGIASATRLPGLLILIPITYIALAVWLKRSIFRPWIAVVLTLAGGAILPLWAFIQFRLSPLVPWKIQEARFVGGLALPGINLWQAIQQIWQGKSSISNAIDIVFLLFFLICFIPVWQRLPRVYSLYYLSFLCLYLTRTSEIQPLLSIDRYVLVFFPALMLMGSWGRNPWINRLILYPSWIGYLYLAGQFAIWGWAG